MGNTQSNLFIKGPTNKSIISNEKPKVLVFTCSYKRPILLRYCLMQMQQQTYPVDHVIYLNTDFSSQNAHLTNYIPLLEDIAPKDNCFIKMSYGRSYHQHINYMKALDLVDLDQYDIICKIDDDDLYKTGYIQEVVDSFIENKWDFSGCDTNGYINNCYYYADTKKMWRHPESDIALGLPYMVPPTYAFSKKAIKIIQQKVTPVDGVWEDVSWRRLLAQTEGISIFLRPSLHFCFHVHGKNVSSSHILQK